LNEGGSEVAERGGDPPYLPHTPVKLDPRGESRRAKLRTVGFGAIINTGKAGTRRRTVSQSRGEHLKEGKKKVHVPDRQVATL